MVTHRGKWVSVVISAEIERSIARKRSSDAVFASLLAELLDQLLRLYGDRLLPVDVGVARRWGLLSAAIDHDGADLLIAATALERGLTVVGSMENPRPVDEPMALCMLCACS